MIWGSLLRLALVAVALIRIPLSLCQSITTKDHSFLLSENNNTVQQLPLSDNSDEMRNDPAKFAEYPDSSLENLPAAVNHANGLEGRKNKLAEIRPLQENQINFEVQPQTSVSNCLFLTTEVYKLKQNYLDSYNHNNQNQKKSVDNILHNNLIGHDNNNSYIIETSYSLNKNITPEVYSDSKIGSLLQLESVTDGMLYNLSENSNSFNNQLGKNTNYTNSHDNLRQRKVFYKMLSSHNSTINEDINVHDHLNDSLTSKFYHSSTDHDLLLENVKNDGPVHMLLENVSNFGDWPNVFIRYSNISEVTVQKELYSPNFTENHNTTEIYELLNENISPEFYLYPTTDNVTLENTTHGIKNILTGSGSKLHNRSNKSFSFTDGSVKVIQKLLNSNANGLKKNDLRLYENTPLNLNYKFMLRTEKTDWLNDNLPVTPSALLASSSEELTKQSSVVDLLINEFVNKLPAGSNVSLLSPYTEKFGVSIIPNDSVTFGHIPQTVVNIPIYMNIFYNTKMVGIPDECTTKSTTKLKLSSVICPLAGKNCSDENSFFRRVHHHQDDEDNSLLSWKVVQNRTLSSSIENVYTKFKISGHGFESTVKKSWSSEAAVIQLSSESSVKSANKTATTVESAVKSISNNSKKDSLQGQLPVDITTDPVLNDQISTHKSDTLGTVCDTVFKVSTDECVVTETSSPNNYSSPAKSGAFPSTKGESESESVSSESTLTTSSLSLPDTNMSVSITYLPDTVVSTLSTSSLDMSASVSDVPLSGTTEAPALGTVLLDKSESDTSLQMSTISLSSTSGLDSFASVTGSTESLRTAGNSHLPNFSQPLADTATGMADTATSMADTMPMRARSGKLNSNGPAAQIKNHSYVDFNDDQFDLLINNHSDKNINISKFNETIDNVLLKCDGILENCLIRSGNFNDSMPNEKLNKYDNLTDFSLLNNLEKNALKVDDAYRHHASNVRLKYKKMNKSVSTTGPGNNSRNPISLYTSNNVTISDKKSYNTTELNLQARDHTYQIFSKSETERNITVLSSAAIQVMKMVTNSHYVNVKENLNRFSNENKKNGYLSQNISVNYTNHQNSVSKSWLNESENKKNTSLNNKINIVERNVSKITHFKFNDKNKMMISNHNNVSYLDKRTGAFKGNLVVNYSRENFSKSIEDSNKASGLLNYIWQQRNQLLNGNILGITGNPFHYSYKSQIHPLNNNNISSESKEMWNSTRSTQPFEKHLSETQNIINNIVDNFTDTGSNRFKINRLRPSKFPESENDVENNMTGKLQKNYSSVESNYDNSAATKNIHQLQKLLLTEITERNHKEGHFKNRNEGNLAVKSFTSTDLPILLTSNLSYAVPEMMVPPIRNTSGIDFYPLIFKESSILNTYLDFMKELLWKEIMSNDNSGNNSNNNDNNRAENTRDYEEPDTYSHSTSTVNVSSVDNDKLHMNHDSNDMKNGVTPSLSYKQNIFSKIDFTTKSELKDIFNCLNTSKIKQTNSGGRGDIPQSHTDKEIPLLIGDNILYDDNSTLVNAMGTGTRHKNTLWDNFITTTPMTYRVVSPVLITQNHNNVVNKNISSPYSLSSQIPINYNNYGINVNNETDSIMQLHNFLTTLKFFYETTSTDLLIPSTTSLPQNLNSALFASNDKNSPAVTDGYDLLNEFNKIIGNNYTEFSYTTPSGGYMRKKIFNIELPPKKYTPLNNNKYEKVNNLKDFFARSEKLTLQNLNSNGSDCVKTKSSLHSSTSRSNSSIDNIKKYFEWKNGVHQKWEKQKNLENILTKIKMKHLKDSVRKNGNHTSNNKYG